MSTTQRQALACHEIGHTVGLDHSTESGSCLRTVTKYGTHDVAHINGRYQETGDETPQAPHSRRRLRRHRGLRPGDGRTADAPFLLVPAPRRQRVRQ
ncbi:matrixin family metalloprotease [Nonomuraea sp. NPDC046802]|uniref:matrixin family metalloprotease n=1 Tax=Nonomuraea sp. NPDC046802 TaxID=3154919 RepID=UPI0033DF971F